MTEVFSYTYTFLFAGKGGEDVFIQHITHTIVNIVPTLMKFAV